MKFLKHFFSKSSRSSGKKNIVFSLLTVSLLSFSFNTSFAQKISATAKVDTNAVLIGGQFILSLEVIQPSGLPVQWPALPDTFALFEVVSRVPADTTINEGDKSITRIQHFKITSFDSGFHVIPAFVFGYQLPGDTAIQTASTEPLLINVQSIAIDTTKAIRDIKGNVAIPFTWKDAIPYASGIILVCLIFLLVYYLIKKFRTKKLHPVIQAPKRPAYEIALEALKSLDDSKLWQQGNYKAYFTGLSDITRMFIQNRWSVAAMEMTTEEILRMQIISGQDPVICIQLKQLLEVADLVKFAKMIPLAHENEQSLKHAYSFVNANRQQAEIREVAP